MDPMLTDLSRFQALQYSGSFDPYGRFDQIKQDAESLQASKGTGAKSAGAAKNSNAAQNDKRLREVSVQFEAIFLKQMLDAMRGTLNTKDDLIQGGTAQNIFEDMLYDQYSQLMAKTGHFGIADMLYREFTNNPAPLNG